MTLKIDLHTHSLASPDGSITPEDYFKALDRGKLDALAITDHNRIDMALKLAQIRPHQIIVGEEIDTSEGELIGLFLSELVPAGLSAFEAANRIKKQGGVVIVPHPMERMRKALSEQAMENILPLMDAVELFNSRSVGSKAQLKRWVDTKNIPAIAVSDAHSAVDLGRSYSSFEELPTAHSFRELAAVAKPKFRRASARGRMAPTLNRLRKPKSE